MKTEQRLYVKGKGWSCEDININSQLVLAFSAPSLVKKKSTYNSLKKFFPNADIILVSTAWEIYDIEVNDNTISVSSLEFKNTKIKVVTEEVVNHTESYSVWEKISKLLNSDELRYVLVFSEWLWINWSKLLDWIKSILDKKVWITWWLAWDWMDVKSTYVTLNWFPTNSKMVVMVGFYWDSIEIWNASVWWWDTFWIERVITKSKDNIVYEIDGEPALELYKRYLWDQAKFLPELWVRFPISIYKSNSNSWIIRSLHAIDEKEWSIIFSWEVPEWNKIFFMKTTFWKLVDWAWKAAQLSIDKNILPDFALLISCTWRRMILRQRVEEEVEIIRDIVGVKCSISGFYSYWEIWISWKKLDYQLHNQTMTVALFSEK